jgi:predicted phosphodiesterase
LSDVHVQYDTAIADFQRALTYAESNCDFTCICGDLTENAQYETQLATYKSIVDTYAKTKPVYAITGNNENYSLCSNGYLSKYTGQPLYYSFTHGDDVFIMVGHYGAWHDGTWQSNEFVSVEELQWLYETLEVNRNKRCFIFNHGFPAEHNVGNPNGFYTSPLIWRTADGGVGQVFISLLKHYKNTVLFHGHSHSRLSLQEKDKLANYSDKDGYRSVHIPSLAVPRDIVDGTRTDMYAESEGYVVDVYDDYIILNARDFIDNDADGHIIPIATYKIDTKLVNVEPNTFTDSTGVITT